MLYNLRKRKGLVAAASKAVEPPDAAQPRGLATAAASQPSSGPLTSMATEDFAVPATPDELMDTPASALLPAAAAASPAAPKKKQRQWEDVGLKVDTSQLLLGVGGAAPAAGAPTADAPLVTSAMRALAARGFTHDMLSAACQHLAQADESECGAMWKGKVRAACFCSEAGWGMHASTRLHGGAAVPNRWLTTQAPLTLPCSAGALHPAGGQEQSERPSP